MNKETRQMIVGLLVFAFSFIVFAVAGSYVKNHLLNWYLYPALLMATYGIYGSINLIQKSIK